MNKANAPTTRLNANAQAWYPAGHRHNPRTGQNAEASPQTNNASGPKYQAQNRLKAINESNRLRSDAVSMMQTQSPQGHGQVPAKSEGDVDADFQYLQGIIARITADPGHFEEVIDIFMQTLHVHLNSCVMMPQLCQFIFTNAIEEASFRYNAARLCVLIQLESAIFAQELKELCQREVEKNRQKPGFTLFLAELYSQGNTSNWKMLYDAVNKLIALGGDENLKTACQTLKLAGYFMEEFDKHRMEDTLLELDQKKGSVKKNIGTLIESVLTLKTHKWGHSTSAMNLSDGAAAAAAPTNGFTSETFYGPGGEELTETERRFLMDNEMDELDDPDELYDPEPEMDEEIQAAFREFVKMGK